MDDFKRLLEGELAEVPEEHFDEARFVPGVGPLDADIVLVGEAPGAREVEEGEPFVGQAGAQLDRVLEDIGVDRDQVYITNVVKVRPPENRTPHVAEIDAWRDVLDAELERISPAVVVPLGTTATQALLDTEKGITEIHGQRFEADGYVIMPTFHPAAILYDRSKRSALVDDLRAAFEAV